MRSKSSDGHAFWWITCRPSRIGSPPPPAPRAPPADPRRTLDLEQRIRALAAAAQLPARPVVLERAGEHSPPGRIERRDDRVAGEARGRLAVEAERDRSRAVDALARLLGKSCHAALSLAGASAGNAVQWTRFVRVSRSAR